MSYDKCPVCGAQGQSQQPNDAARIASLERWLELVRGAMRAEDERLKAAAARAGVLDVGCDIPEMLVDEVLELRSQLAALREAAGGVCAARDTLGSVAFGGNAPSPMELLLRAIAALDAARKPTRGTLTPIPQGTGNSLPDSTRGQAKPRSNSGNWLDTP
jgi:hypothetical protein